MSKREKRHLRPGDHRSDRHKPSSWSTREHALSFLYVLWWQFALQERWMASLTGIERAHCQFSSVRFSSTVCKYVQFVWWEWLGCCHGPATSSLGCHSRISANPAKPAEPADLANLCVVACALAQKACRDGYAALYTRAQSLFRDLAMARADGSLRSLLARLSRIDVLVIDRLSYGSTVGTRAP